jgi:hypothetical protein
MDDSEKKLREALADGPSKGPWKHMTYMSGTQNVEFPGSRGVTFFDVVLDRDAREVCFDNDCKPYPWLDIAHRPEDIGNDADPQRTRNARYVAAASPLVVASLLAELDALRMAKK